MEEQEFLIQFFKYDHLPAHLQEVSKPFGDLAQHMVTTLARNPERTTALRKLLEAKDCAVRADAGGPAANVNTPLPTPSAGKGGVTKTSEGSATRIDVLPATGTDPSDSPTPASADEVEQCPLDCHCRQDRCVCGHSKTWHSGDRGYCYNAIDGSDGCKAFRPATTSTPRTYQPDVSKKEGKPYTSRIEQRFEKAGPFPSSVLATSAVPERETRGVVVTATGHKLDGLWGDCLLCHGDRTQPCLGKQPAPATPPVEKGPTRGCAVNGCPNPVAHDGVCDTHYGRWHDSEFERLADYVEWRGAVYPNLKSVPSVSIADLEALAERWDHLVAIDATPEVSAEEDAAFNHAMKRCTRDLRALLEKARGR